VLAARSECADRSGSWLRRQGSEGGWAKAAQTPGPASALSASIAATATTGCPHLSPPRPWRLIGSPPHASPGGPQCLQVGGAAVTEHERGWHYGSDAHISRARCCSFAESRPAESCLLQHLHTRLYGAALRRGGSRVCRAGGTVLNLRTHAGLHRAVCLCAMPPSHQRPTATSSLPARPPLWRYSIHHLTQRKLQRACPSANTPPPPFSGWRNFYTPHPHRGTSSAREAAEAAL
jgi:hypothetical protein